MNIESGCFIKYILNNALSTTLYWDWWKTRVLLYFPSYNIWAIPEILKKLAKPSGRIVRFRLEIELSISQNRVRHNTLITSEYIGVTQNSFAPQTIFTDIYSLSSLRLRVSLYITDAYFYLNIWWERGLLTFWGKPQFEGKTKVLDEVTAYGATEGSFPFTEPPRLRMGEDCWAVKHFNYSASN